MEEIFDVHTLNIANAASEHIVGNSDETALRMLFGKDLEILKMLVLYFLCRFDLNGNAGIANDGIDFNACVGAPVGKVLLAVSIMQPCHQFLHNQMFESMTIIGRPPYQFFSV